MALSKNSKILLSDITGAIKGLSVSGKTVTYTKLDGTTGTITTQDTNTTYSNFTKATSSAAGKAGLVPAPAKGAQTKFLRGDATWQTISTGTATVVSNVAAWSGWWNISNSRWYVGVGTFEEFLKGIETNTITEEQLEEAYSPEMKQVISKEELSKIGNFLNRRFDISVQNTDFHMWKNLDTHHLKFCDFAIVVMTDGAVKIVKKSGNSLEIVYPNSYGTLTAKDMKNVKAAFGLDTSWHNDTASTKRNRKLAKPGEDILVQKSELLKDKIEYSKNKSIVEPDCSL